MKCRDSVVLVHILLERRLTNEGKYEQFKQIFNESSGKEWVDERQGGAFILKHIAFALNKLDVMTEEDTRTWYNEQSKDYHISIEDFGKLVQEYCEKRKQSSCGFPC